jgi:hypothetical protein
METPVPRETAFKAYRLIPVYGSVPPDLRGEITAMWRAAGVLLPDEARRRVDEVVIAIRNPAGELAGVNTAFAWEVPGGSGTWYFYRTFVRKADRGVPGLPSASLRAAVAVLRDHPHPGAPLGIVAVVENAKLSKPGSKRRMERLGLHLIGRDDDGHDIWCLRFDGAVPVAPPGLLRPV